MTSRALGDAAMPALAKPRRVLVVGAGPGSELLNRSLQGESGSHADVIGMVAVDRPARPTAWPYLGDLDALAYLLTAHRVSDVAICLDGPQWSRIESLARTCSQAGVAITIPVAELGSSQNSSASLGRLHSALKRLMDIVGATTGLALAAPILVIAAIAILVDDGPPIFFRQERAGHRGRSFRILKLRTMLREADSLRPHLRSSNEISAAAFKMADDPRVTRVGHWLRRASVDELPQLWNVLKGEMSLVGPRPHPYDDLAGYETWHMRRLAVKPGVTGLWQVELRGDTDFDRWVQKDIEYIERWSIWLDIQLIARTLPAVVRGTGR